MSTPQIVTQLLLKRAEIEAQIESLTARLAQAKADLLHVSATVALFDPTALTGPATAYHGVTKALKRSDLFDLCKAALEAATDPLSARASSPSMSSRPRVGTRTTGASSSA